MKVIKCSLLLLLVALKCFNTSSPKHLKSQINISGRAIAYLIDKLSVEYQMRLHIVTLKNDYVAERVMNKIFSLSSSSISSSVLHRDMKELVYEFGMSYILIAKNNALSTGYKVEPRSLPVLRFFTFYGTSIFLNYAYDADNAANEEKDICNIRHRNHPYFHPHQFFQLLYTRKPSKSLKLLNCVLFQSRKCKPEMKIVNKFSSRSYRWNSEKFITNY